MTASPAAGALDLGGPDARQARRSLVDACARRVCRASGVDVPAGAAPLGRLMEWNDEDVTCGADVLDALDGARREAELDGRHAEPWLSASFEGALRRADQAAEREEGLR